MRSGHQSAPDEQTAADPRLGALARRLRDAERQGRQLAATAADVSTDLAQGYQVQRIGHRLRSTNGASRAGYKIGVTSAAAQRAQGATEPVSGYLLRDTVRDDHGGDVVTGLFAPRVEAEVAFLLARPLSGSDVGADDVLAATGQIAPALEIVDTRWAGGAPSLSLLVADNVSAGRVVLGRRMPADHLGDAIEMKVDVGGTQVTGDSGNVLGHPLRAVAWLARHLARQGVRLEAGEVVLSGTLCSPVSAEVGDRASADFGRLGQVTTRFG